MSEMTEAYDWKGRDVVGSGGEKIGTLEEVYVDTQTGEPAWAAINTGLFGMKQSFVPLTQAAPQGGSVAVPHTKEQVKDAPGVEPDGELNSEEEAALFGHYGLAYEPASTEPPSEPVGQDVSGPTTDDAMTRSEEELHVGKAQRESGRVRLRKYVVTEEVQQTVPVQREEVRIEREPITEGNVDQALDGPEISDEEHEVILHEEEVVTEKRTVPKERVRVDKETLTDEAQVSDEVRKEQIEVEEDAPRG